MPGPARLDRPALKPGRGCGRQASRHRHRHRRIWPRRALLSAPERIEPLTFGSRSPPRGDSAELRRHVLARDVLVLGAREAPPTVRSRDARRSAGSAHRRRRAPRGARTGQAARRARLRSRARRRPWRGRRAVRRRPGCRQAARKRALSRASVNPRLLAMCSPVRESTTTQPRSPRSPPADDLDAIEQLAQHRFDRVPPDRRYTHAERLRASVGPSSSRQRRGAEQLSHEWLSIRRPAATPGIRRARSAGQARRLAGRRGAGGRSTGTGG
jgi:hypothetical protein